MAGNTTIRHSGRGSVDDDWRLVAETVTPLRRNRRLPAASRPDPAPAGEKAPEAPGVVPAAAGRPPAPEPPPPRPPANQPGPADLDQHKYGGISRADAKRIKSGKVPIDGRIDLHGLSLAQAENSLKRFVLSAAGGGDRTVLVVTGKGRGGTGVIRKHLPVWLNQPPLRSLVVAYGQAQRRDGGSGAYYVRLRGK